MQGPFLLCLCQRGAFTGSQMISFSAVPLSRKRKAVSDRPIHKWNKPSCTAGKPGRMILSVRPDTLGQTYKIILPCRWFTRFHASGSKGQRKKKNRQNPVKAPLWHKHKRKGPCLISLNYCLGVRQSPFLRLCGSRHTFVQNLFGRWCADG